ncbi:MAG: lipoprotein signal peptidase [Ralstonia sp.]|jgi:signal peptidase II|uniref:Lipoprotein signal peptidase n=2 Tax=Ralstonia TaxID=48736 RepID=A0AAD2BTS8_9RALS|nr:MULTISPECIES: signal peptidase II [Ralstonia]MCL6470622.1 lipoprotein signal peptidase [Ralstonia sp.]NOZ14372.1 signal peptidase II [Betaproteobacteria bacterium]MCK8653267.1 signal peptidase II [Ralstonia insidiosa]NPA02749.1 signal peptidase II [Betaproteobacteria bacterium]NYS10921.1 lipoprotein signal peptidase [Ralstonia pickettii]
MNWKFLVYDWGGWNVAMFSAINSATPSTLDPVAWFFSLIGNYWTAPLLLLTLWWWSVSVSNPARACAVRQRLITFGVAFVLALLAASTLKWWLDFPRPPAVLGHLVHVIGVAELHYSLPSGHATYAALVAGALWPLVGFRGRLGLVLYAASVGWSRVAAGMHFPADVLAGWTLGTSCVAVAGYAAPLLAAMWIKHRGTPNVAWYGIAACCFMADQAAKFAITRTFAYGERIEVTSTFDLVYVRNPGAAFSFLADAGGWQRYLFMGLSLVVSVWLAHVLRKRLSNMEALAYSLILGGAAGNLADRIWRGQVVDFLDLHWMQLHWPAFNLADVAITTGAGCLMLAVLMQRQGTTAKSLSG